MELQTIAQTYLVPATSQTLTKALTTLASLGLTHEEPRVASSPTETLFALVVQVPIIPVVHHFDLLALRQEILADRQKRTDRPSHREAINWSYGSTAITTAYPDAFFSPAAQAELTYAVTELVVRERIIQHFATQNIIVYKITLSKPANEGLGNGWFIPRQEGWYAFVEEARPAIPELGTLLGAI